MLSPILSPKCLKVIYSLDFGKSCGPKEQSVSVCSIYPPSGIMNQLPASITPFLRVNLLPASSSCPLGLLHPKAVLLTGDTASGQCCPLLRLEVEKPQVPPSSLISHLKLGLSTEKPFPGSGSIASRFTHKTRYAGFLSSSHSLLPASLSPSGLLFLYPLFPAHRFRRSSHMQHANPLSTQLL